VAIELFHKNENVKGAKIMSKPMTSQSDENQGTSPKQRKALAILARHANSARIYIRYLTGRLAKMRAGVATSFLLLIATSVPAQQMTGIVRPLEAVQFAQDSDVKCMRSAVEAGDAATGPSTVFLRMPPGCVVPWHFHTAKEQAIIIQGRVIMAMKRVSSTTMSAGGFALMESRVPHQFSCSGRQQCLVMVLFDGKYDITWGGGS